MLLTMKEQLTGSSIPDLRESKLAMTPVLCAVRNTVHYRNQITMRWNELLVMAAGRTETLATFHVDGFPTLHYALTV